MKKKICGVLVVIGLFLILGIVGGCDIGQPVINGLWCFPILGAMFMLVKIGRLDEEE